MLSLLNAHRRAALNTHSVLSHTKQSLSTQQQGTVYTCCNSVKLPAATQVYTLELTETATFTPPYVLI